MLNRNLDRNRNLALFKPCLYPLRVWWSAEAWTGPNYPSSADNQPNTSGPNITDRLAVWDAEAAMLHLGWSVAECSSVVTPGLLGICCYLREEFS